MNYLHSLKPSTSLISKWFWFLLLYNKLYNNHSLCSCRLWFRNLGRDSWYAFALLGCCHHTWNSLSGKASPEGRRELTRTANDLARNNCVCQPAQWTPQQDSRTSIGLLMSPGVYTSRTQRGVVWPFPPALGITQIIFSYSGLKPEHVCPGSQEAASSHLRRACAWSL